VVEDFVYPTVFFCFLFFHLSKELIIYDIFFSEQKEARLVVLVFFAQIVGDKYPMSKEGKEGKEGKKGANRIDATAELFQSALVPERSGSVQVSWEIICLLGSQAFNKDGLSSYKVKEYSKRKVTIMRREGRTAKSKRKEDKNSGTKQKSS